ncbi:MAG: hypothetical protein J7539_18490 [Niabella sp.]|nr:hypothetical protein [Niabella sp.]
MSIDDLINSALKERGGVLDAANLYALVGDTRTGELFVLNLQDFFIDNLEYFRNGEETWIILIGAYATEEAARVAIKTLNDEKPLGDGLIVSPEFHILLGNAKENKLFVLPLKEYYIGYLGLFLYKVDSGNVAISIFNTRDAAEDAIDMIRTLIMDERGNSII